MFVLHSGRFGGANQMAARFGQSYKPSARADGSNVCTLMKYVREAVGGAVVQNGEIQQYRRKAVFFSLQNGVGIDQVSAIARRGESI